MALPELGTKFVLDITDFQAKSKILVQEMNRLKEGLKSVTGDDRAGKNLDKLGVSYRRITRELKEQLRVLEQLESLRAAGGRGSRALGAGAGKALSAAGVVGAGGKLTPGRGRGDAGARVSVEQIDKAIVATTASIRLLGEEQAEAFGAFDAQAAKAGAAYAFVDQRVQELISHIQQMQALTRGGAEANLRAGLASGAESQIAQIDQQIREIRAANAAQSNQRRQKNLEAVPALLRRANNLRKEGKSLERQITRETNRQAVAAVKGVDATEKQVQALSLLRQRRFESAQDEDALRRKARRPQDLEAGDLKQAGQDKDIEELGRRRKALLDFSNNALKKSGDFIGQNSKLIADELSLIKTRNTELLLGVKHEDQRNQLIAENARSQDRIGRETARLSAKGGDLQGAFDANRIKQAVSKARPGINRLFENVFQDMGRRFTATLQFAISGAAIFGAQKLVREFFEAAIDVERAFADIESALEFDIEAPRNTTEFKLEVESVRREILLLADTYNVLPVEANKAAFVMISRFKDTGNAMIALRAQLLATKVSTIDQSETLRALTAVAEGFSAAVFDGTGILDLNERLLRREAIAASLYGRALDLAVQIQQKFGVEVEDTLEGGARATEVFRQMGFTMEETFAIVAATSRELGQTGQQVAERLNRSLGQLTDPKIRDALLDLAGASSAFNIEIRDFDTGARAWERIVDQFERLENVDPKSAQKVLQIIGQRRELEAVAAALGTSDLQASIVAGASAAAGAADQRFAFLSRTISELIASISVGFQSLAQNFERLGGISSFKILLTTVETLIKAMNSMLEILLLAKDALDSFSGVPFGSVISKFALLTLAVGGALRVALALRKTFTKLTTQKGFLSGFFRLGGGDTPEAFLLAQTARQNALSAGRFPGRGAVAAGKSLGGSAASAVSAHPVIAMAAAAAVAALSLKALHDAGKALEKSFKEGSDSIKQASIEARRRIADEDLTGREADLVRQELRVEAIKGLAATTTVGQPGLLEMLGAAGLAGVAGSVGIIPTAISGVAGGPDPFAPLREVAARSHNPQNIPGTQQYWARLLEESTEQFLRTQSEEIRDAISDIPEPTEPLDSSAILAIAAAANVGFGRRGGKGVLELAREALNEKLNEALAELADDAGKSQSERDIDTANVITVFAEIQQVINEVVNAYEDFITESGQSINQLNNALAGLDNDIFLGRETAQSAATEALRISKNLRTASEDFEATGDTEEAARAREDSEKAYIDGLRRQEKNAQDAVSRRTFFADQETQLSESIISLRQDRADAEDRGEDTLHLDDQIREEVKQLRDVRRSNSTAVKQHRIAMARSFAEKDAATRDYIKELRRQAIAEREVLGNNQLANELERTAELAEKQRIDDAREEAIAAREAQIRLNAPALSGSARLIAQISAVKSRIANAQKDNDSTRIATLTVELRELLAQQAQNELQKLTALTLSKVSVRDSLGQILVQLSSLEREAELTAIIFGDTSKEFLNASRAVLETKATIQNMALDLESINRQLAGDFDVTSSLDAANEDYIRVMRALQIPDLGPIEEAGLLLEKKNAIAAQIAAQFDEGLFNLKFQFERGDLGLNGYIASLKTMLAEVDISTDAGKKLWIQINGLIDGLVDDISGAAFNIPGQIRLPTLFEVRRAVQAESLGVNYLDNRDQTINVFISDDVQADVVFDAIAGAFEVEDLRNAPGGAGITLGVL
jgi:hypothetical protein